MVFFIVDLFLTEGVNTIFHISLALLGDSKKDLLQLDFEGMNPCGFLLCTAVRNPQGILKYFRVTLPRRYRTEASAKELLHKALKLKVGDLPSNFPYLRKYPSLSDIPQKTLQIRERVQDIKTTRDGVA